MNPREIMGHPEVRARIEAVTGANPKGMSAEQFYKYARPVMMITGAGPAPPLQMIKDISLPISAKLGMKTSRDVTQGFRNTFGETLAAVLCSLASRSQPVEAHHRTPRMAASSARRCSRPSGPGKVT
jgi:hypothetical protein